VGIVFTRSDIIRYTIQLEAVRARPCCVSLWSLITFQKSLHGCESSMWPARKYHDTSTLRESWSDLIELLSLRDGEHSFYVRDIILVAVAFGKSHNSLDTSFPILKAPRDGCVFLLP